jgi:hypothetical protein
MRAAALLVVLVGVAWADDASTLFRRGVESLRAQDYASAATAFQQSYALSPKEATMCNLALTYDRWPGHVAEAVESYRKCAEDDLSGRFRDHALERARQLREQLAATPPVEKTAPPVEDEPQPKVEPPKPQPPRSPPPVLTPPELPPPVAASAPDGVKESALPSGRTRSFFRDPTAVSLTALGVAGIAAGVGVAVAGKMDDDAIAGTADLGQKTQLYKSAGILEPVGYVTLAVGAALIVAGIVEWAAHGRYMVEP